MLKTRPSGGCSKKGVSIPPQPQVLRDLYKKLTNGEADVRVYARLLTMDPGLVAMLFKVARNASYRRYQPFESVEHILPEFICDAIRYHHDLRHMGNHAARTMAAILQLAIHLYHEDLRLPNPEWESVRPDVLDELMLRDDTLPELMDVALEQYHAASPR